MQRPLSIVWFERCYLGALVVGLINSALSWNAALAAMAENPALADLGENFGRNTLIFGTVFGVAISVLLWYFAACKRAAVAKWIITVFFAISVLSIGFSALRNTFPQGIAGVLGIVTFVLNAIAVWQLFRPDAAIWFGEKPADGQAGPIA